MMMVLWSGCDGAGGSADRGERSGRDGVGGVGCHGDRVGGCVFHYLWSLSEELLLFQPQSLLLQLL